MLGFISPYYLFAVILIPLIWWLHKFQSYERTTVVSSLLYWRSPTNNMNLGIHGRQSHPLWLLRALIILLLILSLASPFWVNDSLQNIDIWVDDSFSMSTQENGIDRKSQAIDSLIKKLKALRNVRAVIHSLSKPDYPVLILKSKSESVWKVQLSDWYKVVTHTPELPLPIQFSLDSEHWLVSDGADENINKWSKAISFNRVIQIGQATENSAITSFSMRLDLKKPNIWHGLVQLHHYGDNATQRSLELVVGSHRLKQWSVTLNPQKLYVISFDIDLGNFAKEALIIRFFNPDVLAEDDHISLQVTKHKTVNIRGECPSALMMAIQTHPSLVIAKKTTKDSDLSILCGDKAINASGPSIQFYSAKQAEPVISSPIWQPSAESVSKLYLQKKWLQYTGHVTQKVDAESILLSAETILLARSKSVNRHVECFVDMDNPSFFNRPEYPVFVAGLVDLALNTSILNKIQSVERDVEQSQVKPIELMLARKKQGKINYFKTTDLTSFLIVFVLILLLLDYWFSIKRTQQYKLSS